MTYRPDFFVINVFCCVSILSGAFSQTQLSPDLQQTLQKIAQSVKGDVTFEVIEQQIPTRTNNQNNFNPIRQQYQPQYNQFPPKPNRQKPQVNLNGYDAAIIIEETNEDPPKRNGNYYIVKDMDVRPFNPGFPPNNNGRPNDFYPYHHHHHNHNRGPPNAQFPYNRQPIDEFGPNWGLPKHGHGMNYDDYDQKYDYDYHHNGPREQDHQKHGQNHGGYDNQGYTTENINLSGDSKDSIEKGGSAINFDDTDHKSDKNNIAGYIGKFPVILLNENEIR